MKTALALFLAMASLASFAQSSNELIIHAKSFSGGGYNRHGDIDQPATECLYALMDYRYQPTEYVALYLNSDEASHANFAVVIKKSMLPLKDGAEFTALFGDTVKYRNGVLTSKKIDFDGLASRDRDVLKIRVSPDLKKIESAHGVTKVVGLIRSLKLRELKCEF